MHPPSAADFLCRDSQMGGKVQRENSQEPAWHWRVKQAKRIHLLGCCDLQEGASLRQVSLNHEQPPCGLHNRPVKLSDQLRLGQGLQPPTPSTRGDCCAPVPRRRWGLGAACPSPEVLPGGLNPRAATGEESVVSAGGAEGSSWQMEHVVE